MQILSAFRWVAMATTANLHRICTAFICLTYGTYGVDTVNTSDLTGAWTVSGRAQSTPYVRLHYRRHTSDVQNWRSAAKMPWNSLVCRTKLVTTRRIFPPANDSQWLAVCVPFSHTSVCKSLIALLHCFLYTSRVCPFRRIRLVVNYPLMLEHTDVYATAWIRARLGRLASMPRWLGRVSHPICDKIYIRWCSGAIYSAFTNFVTGRPLASILSLIRCEKWNPPKTRTALF